VGVTDPHFMNLAAGKTQDFFLTLAQLPVVSKYSISLKTE
jgi:hypothetical protein